MKGAIAVSAAALFAKVLSAAYRIPYQNIAGDVGFYVYQQLYPFYGFVMLVSMYGFPVVLSKHIAEQEAKARYDQARLTMAVSFYSLFILAALLWGSLHLTAPLVAMAMGDINLVAPIRAVALTFWLMPFLSIGRGYHQAKQRLTPTAISHISEQFVRVTMILVFVVMIVGQTGSPYDVAIGAIYGSLIGGITGVVVLIFLSRGVSWQEWFKVRGASFRDIWRIHSILIKQGIFVCISALLFIFFQFIDAFTVVPSLAGYGLRDVQAFTEKGIYDRGQPLLQLGTIVTTTFSLTLVPLLAKSLSTGEKGKARLYQDVALRLTILIGGAASVGLISIIQPTNMMLYGSVDGSFVLAVLSLAIFFSSLYLITSAILQGYGRVHVPAHVMALGIVVKLCLNLLLIPFIGTLGAALATVLATALMASIQLIALKKLQRGLIADRSFYYWTLATFTLLALCTVSWQIGLQLVLPFDGSRYVASITALSTVSVGGIVMVACFIYWPFMTNHEWETVPKLNKLRNVLRRK